MGKRYLKREDFGQRYEDVSPEGLVLWLDQSDPRSYGDLSIWHDLSGLHNDGTQGTGANQPAITGVAGLNGSARSFDGGDFIDSGATITLTHIDADITISSWVRVNTVVGTLSVLGERGAGATSGFEFSLEGDHLQLVVFGAVGQDSSPTGIVVDEWVLVGVTYDESNIIFYINGDLLSSHAQASAIGDSASSAYVGALNNRETPDSFFDGYISTLMVFNRTLIAAEMQRLWQADIARHGGI